MKKANKILVLVLSLLLLVVAIVSYFKIQSFRTFFNQLTSLHVIQGTITIITARRSFAGCVFLQINIKTAQRNGFPICIMTAKKILTRNCSSCIPAIWVNNGCI